MGAFSFIFKPDQPEPKNMVDCAWWLPLCQPHTRDWIAALPYRLLELPAQRLDQTAVAMIRAKPRDEKRGHTEVTRNPGEKTGEQAPLFSCSTTCLFCFNPSTQAAGKMAELLVHQRHGSIASAIGKITCRRSGSAIGLVGVDAHRRGCY